MEYANTNIAPLSRNGDSASGNPAPATQTPGAHFTPLDLDEERLTSLRHMVANMGAAELRAAAKERRIDRHFEGGRFADLYDRDRKAMALQQCLIRAKHVVLACVLFWLAVAWIWAAPEAVPLLSGAGFETCTNGSC